MSAEPGQSGFPADGSGIPIANSALTLVGTRLISTVSDASKECLLVKTNWNTYRRALLRMGIWKFAKEYVQLASDQTFNPQYGYKTRFPLPDDFIRLVSFNELKGNSDGDGAPYRIMNGFIYTYMSYGNLTYIPDVADVSQYDPLFCEAFSALIYDKLCHALTGTDADPKKFKKAIQDARFVGSVEDPSEQLDVDVWLQSRVGNGGLFRDPQFAQDPNLDFPTTPEQ
jgi:hypothetical protein